MIIRCMLFIILAFITTMVNAELPASISCKSIAISDEASIPSVDKPTLILIHNLSKLDLWLTPILSKSESNEEIEEASRLEKGHWSALTLNGTALKLNCVESVPGHEQMVPCTGAISICRSTFSKIPKNLDKLWIGENMVLATLIEYLGSRGFELNSSKEEDLA